jgi:uncharacterized protein YejL (UPF0352 family)
MKKTVAFILFISMSFVVNAQTISAKDSLAELELLMDMIDSLDKPKSYFDVSLGIGNKLFSVNNNSVNASQSQVQKIFFTPSIAYYHKSGFSIAITPYLTSDSGAMKVYQTAITPSFDYEGDNFAAGVSYTRYLADNTSYNTNATYQNDLFGYFKYTKPVIQPSLSLGFSNGSYNEINLVSFKPIIGPERIIKDSTNNTISDFSLSIGIEHSFQFDSVFSTKGSLYFTPQLVLNTGSGKYSITHVNKLLVKAAQKNKRVKSSSLTESGKIPFEFQSLALSLTADYSIGKFTVSPNVYFDYYLPTTTENRFSTIFSLSLGFAF